MMYLIVNVFLRTDTNRKIPRGGIPPGTFQEVANSPTRNAKNASKVKIISHKDHLAGYICRNQPKKGAVETTAPYNIGSVT
jgi:hypothetical protein